MSFLVPIDNQLLPAAEGVHEYGQSLKARGDAIETARKGVFIGAVIGLVGGAAFAFNDKRMFSVLTAMASPVAGYMIGHQRAVARWRSDPALVQIS